MPSEALGRVGLDHAPERPVLSAPARDVLVPIGVEFVRARAEEGRDALQCRLWRTAELFGRQQKDPLGWVVGPVLLQLQVMAARIHVHAVIEGGQGLIE